ncbi:NAD-dependent epimerase/dehydratase family protein [Gorillibacterium sp. sgz5001074]|uniref:NAD-dependent epimerase/dehydratase family protein n=1 Tax=Gorillibacterium sp. sgz5001074 TaxID=3446695 RepID=UPI003F668413
MERMNGAEPMNVILTGATGMVGEGVLHECLHSPEVGRVLVLGRRSCGATHPKLQELVREDLFELAADEELLSGYDACFYCLGISSVGRTEEDYSRITYDLTLRLAETMARLNPRMVFCYVTGEGTGRGGSMWARVKGRTEQALLQLPFRGAYMFRPGYIHPTPGLKNTHGYYRAIAWMYPVLRKLFPRHVTTLRELGTAMIRCGIRGSGQAVLENPDIAAWAEN